MAARKKDTRLSALAGLTSHFENEARDNVEKKNRDGHVALSRRRPDRLPVQRPRLSICFGHSPSCTLSSLSHIYFYIFLDLFCAEGSCLAWPAPRHWTSCSSPRSVLKNPDRVQKHSALLKNKSRNISPLHNSLCRRRKRRVAVEEVWCVGSELFKPGRVQLHGWRRVMTKQGELFFIY